MAWNRSEMARGKAHTPTEVVTKSWQVEVLVADAVPLTGVAAAGDRNAGA